MKFKKQFDKNLIVIFIIILLLCSACFTAIWFVGRISTDSCFRSLQETGEFLAEQIKEDMIRNQEQLEVIASILGSFDDLTSAQAEKIVCSFERRSMISSLGLLMPDSSLLLCDGSRQNSPLFDFQSMLESLPYISGIHSPLDQPDSRFIYYAVPVIQANETTAILLGFVSKDLLLEHYNAHSFNESAEIFIVDGANGDLILDTWHDFSGNIFSEEFEDRNPKPGYSFERLLKDTIFGKSGVTSFFSQNAQEHFYAFYTPVGINQWTILVSVLESDAFADAVRIRHILYLLIVINLILLLIYFFGVSYNNRKKNLMRETQLMKSFYMIDIQQTLFNAHKKPDLIGNALEKCARMTQADIAFLIVLDGIYASGYFIWSEKTKTFTEEKAYLDVASGLPYLWANLSSRKSMIINDLSQLKEIAEKDLATFSKYHIRNAVFTPVLDSEKNLAGLLCLSNYDTPLDSAEFLECVSLNFFMALNNLFSFRQIQEMSTVDSLTGLYNRNKYQLDLEYYSSITSSLCCIYLDANGLHELNNHLGHAAGDAMLRCIGSNLKEIFGADSSYRIGGDEFVCFCNNYSEKTVLEKITFFQKQLAQHNYHVSVGTAYQNTSVNISHIISEAEHKMYENKRRYYSEKGDLSKAREMNHKLEQLLLEKKDYDSFLSIISSYFLGVYVVDLCTNLTRTIYKPSYFDAMLKQNDYRFRESLYCYIDTYVVEEDRLRFKEYLDYKAIERDLTAGKIGKLTYRKTNGSRLVMRIFPSNAFGKNQQETFWLFEEDTSSQSSPKHFPIQ